MLVKCPFCTREFKKISCKQVHCSSNCYVLHVDVPDEILKKMHEYIATKIKTEPFGKEYPWTNEQEEARKKFIYLWYAKEARLIFFDSKKNSFGRKEKNAIGVQERQSSRAQA